MSFPRYPAYKDSGVEWLSSVPAHWRVERLKHVATVFPSNVDKKSYDDEVPVRLCNYTDVYYNDEIREDMDLMMATATAEQIEKFSLCAGDTIITKDSETSDDIAISAYVPNDLPGIVCGYHLSMVRPKSGGNGRFLKRFFDSQVAKAQAAVSANGLTRVGLGQYAIDNLHIAVPPVEEQLNIGDFLERETAKIDALVAEQEQLITLLKEKRQAVISHAVTKGLGPSVQMKYSGVEWLGEVPAHWDVIPLKHLVIESVAGPYGASLTKDMYSSEGYRVYGQQQVIADDFSVGDYFIPDDKYEEMRRYTVYANDVLVSVMGTIGKVAVVTSDAEPGIINPRLVRYRCGDQVQPRFLQRVLMSQKHQEHLLFEAKGTTMDGLNMQTLGRVPVPTPPLIEQAEILDFVARKIGELDPLLAEAEAAVSLLQERRAALISAAVTGQIDVRGLAAAQAQAA